MVLNPQSYDFFKRVNLQRFCKFADLKSKMTYVYLMTTMSSGTRPEATVHILSLLVQVRVLKNNLKKNEAYKA